MDKKEKNRLVVPIMCFLMSVVLWVYVTNVENKIRTTEISKIPVELVNLDALTSSNLALAPDQDFYVTLKVEGNTSDINQIRKSDFKVQVDLSEYAWKVGENKVPVSIVDYPISVSIRNTSNLTILIEIETMTKKTMSITPNINITAKSGYFVSEPSITPEEIEVSGPESAVKSVEMLVITDNKEEVSEDVIGEYVIKPVDKNGDEVLDVELSSSTATVEVKVSKGKLVNINITTTNELPMGIKLDSIKSNKEYVELLGPREVLETIDEISTTPIDLSTITNSKDISLNLLIPEGLTVAEGEGLVSARINVISMKIKEFSVKLNITGTAEGMNVLPDKEYVIVKIKGYEDEIESITEDNIEVTLDISQYKEEGTYDATPKVTLKNVNESFVVETVENVKLTVSKEIVQNTQDDESEDN